MYCVPSFGLLVVVRPRRQNYLYIRHVASASLSLLVGRVDGRVTRYTSERVSVAFLCVHVHAKINDYIRARARRTFDGSVVYHVPVTRFGILPFSSICPIISSHLPFPLFSLGSSLRHPMLFISYPSRVLSPIRCTLLPVSALARDHFVRRRPTAYDRITRRIRVVSPREKPNLPNSIMPACRERHTAWPRATIALSSYAPIDSNQCPWQSVVRVTPIIAHFAPSFFFSFFLARVNRPSLFGNPSCKVDICQVARLIGRLSGRYVCVHMHIWWEGNSGLRRKERKDDADTYSSGPDCQRVRNRCGMGAR